MEKPKQTLEEYLREKASMPLTKAEEEMHGRVFEMAAATGADPLTCMTAGSAAVLGQRMYGGKDSIKRQIVACAESMIKEVAAMKAVQERGSILCPVDDNKIILPGSSGPITH